MMKPFFIYLAIGFSFISIHMEAQRNALTEIKTNTVQKDFRQIIILGSGSVETRAFLDILSSNLIAELKNKKINSAYYFTGKNTDRVPDELNQYLIDSFQAILVFRPLDSSQYSQMRYERKIDLLSPFFGEPNAPNYSRKIDFRAVFNLQLYAPQQASGAIWGAMLEVDGDFMKNPQIEVIVKKIMSSLKANKVLR